MNRFTFRVLSNAFVALFTVLWGPLLAVAAPFKTGDVFVGVSQSLIQHYDADLNLIETLNTGVSGPNNSPVLQLDFNKEGNLYALNSSAGSISVFRASDGALLGTFGAGFASSPKSIFFDAHGNLHIGHGQRNIVRKIDALGNLAETYLLAQGGDNLGAIDLAKDQKTLFYTSLAPQIGRFDTSTKTERPSFVTLPHSGSFRPLRILPDGGVLAADGPDIHRFDAAGTLIQTYDAPGQDGWASLYLDPDGRSFWGSDFLSSMILKFDINSGLVLAQKNTGFPPGRIQGLAVYEGITAAKQAASDVKIVETLSTAGIELDPISLSPPPARITNDSLNNRVTLEWEFPHFSVGQKKDLLFEVNLKTPVPGEDRLVSHRLEVLYTDANGQAGRLELGPRSVHVLGIPFATSVVTDKPEYTADELVRIALSITHLGPVNRTVDAVVQIEDNQGIPLQPVISLPGLSFTPGETKHFPGLIYDTGKVFAGSYRVRAAVTETGRELAGAAANFTILPVTQVASGIVADKASYSSNEMVTLTSTITSQNSNAILANLSAVVTVTNTAGLPIFNETRRLADLLPEAKREFKSFTNTGTHTPGVYAASLKVHSGESLISSTTRSFEIFPSAAQSAALSGSVAIDPSRILERESATLSFTVRNIGNEVDLPQIDTAILIVDPDTETAVRTMTGQISLNGREVFADGVSFEAGILPPKAYLIVLQGTTAGVTQTLASAGLQIDAVPNHAPSANAGSNRTGLVGQPVLLDGSASADPDGDPLTFVWQFDSVPLTSQVSDAALANAGTPGPSFVPDSEGIYNLRLVVNDGLVDSPVDTVSVFVNPAPRFDLHPETINLKSNGGSKSVTGVLSSPVLSAFAFFTAPDGVTITAPFTLENRYVDKNGNMVNFTIPADDYPGDDQVHPVDTDGDGSLDLYRLTLKFNRDLIIAGFKDANGALKISRPTDLISRVVGNDLPIGSDTNTVIAPPEVSIGGK